MTMSKDERAKYGKKMIKLFKRVRQILKIGEEQYICYSLDQALQEILEEKGLDIWEVKADDWVQASDFCVKYINEKLAPVTVYDTWVLNNWPKAYSKMARKLDELQEADKYMSDTELNRKSPFTKGRRAWLSAIIETMEKN